MSSRICCFQTDVHDYSEIVNALRTNRRLLVGEDGSVGGTFTVSESRPALIGTKSLAPSAKSGKISQPDSSTCAWHPAELASAWAQR